MKITRRQLRRLIEGSVKKRGGYTIPAENPIGDPLKDLDYSSDQKSKIKMLALSGDEEIQTQADLIADIGGYEADDRFGADTFSRQVQAGELGIDMLNDLDIDSALSKACEYWIYENKDYLSYFDHIDQDTFRDYADYMIEEYAPDIIVSNIKTHTLEVLNKRIKSLIAISNSAAAVPSVDASIAKYESAKKLFSLDHDNPIVEDHVMDKFKSILYSFYLDWKVYYEKEQGWDMHNPESVKRYKERIATFKEGKIKLTKNHLRKLISEAMFSPHAATSAARERVKQSISPEKMANLDTYLRSDNEDSVVQGHSVLDTLGDYESPSGDSYQDIKYHDNTMENSSLIQKRYQMLDDWSNYIQRLDAKEREIISKLINSGTQLHVTTDIINRNDNQAPPSEVVKDPEGFNLLSVTSPPGFSLANEVSAHSGIDFQGYDQDAIFYLLDKIVGWDQPVKPEPFDASVRAEVAFIAWLTENIPNMKIYVDA